MPLVKSGGLAKDAAMARKNGDMRFVDHPEFAKQMAF